LRSKEGEQAEKGHRKGDVTEPSVPGAEEARDSPPPHHPAQEQNRRRWQDKAHPKKADKAFPGGAQRRDHWGTKIEEKPQNNQQKEKSPHRA